MDFELSARTPPFSPPDRWTALAPGVKCRVQRGRAGAGTPDDPELVKLDVCQTGPALREDAVSVRSSLAVNLPDDLLAETLGEWDLRITFLLRPLDAGPALEELSAAVLGTPISLRAVEDQFSGKGGFVLSGCPGAAGSFLPPDMPAEFTYGYLRLKLLELLWVLTCCKDRAVPAGQVRRDRRGGLIADIRCDLVSHLDQRLTAEEICRRYHVSASWLKTAFRARYGAPVDTYLRRCRVDAACRLLRETSHSVGEIAQMVGYDSQSRFSAVFRAQTGLTPSAYRGK